MLVHLRNKKVRRNILANHSRYGHSDSRFNVAFVSNSWYRAHLSGYDDDDSIPGSISATGIPGLREEAARIPAKSRFDRLETFCDGWLWGAICSLEMWATATAIERRQELRALTAKPQGVCHVPHYARSTADHPSESRGSSVIISKVLRISCTKQSLEKLVRHPSRYVYRADMMKLLLMLDGARRCADLFRLGSM